MCIIISCRIMMSFQRYDVLLLSHDMRIMMSFQRYDVYYYLMQDYDVISEI